MSWRDRLRQMILAGGAFSLTACGGANLSHDQNGPFDSGGCGNANPDPCICDRPRASADAAAACDAKIACEAAGGTYNPYSVYDSTTGITTPPHCELDGGAAPDGAPASDGESDGV